MGQRFGYKIDVVFVVDATDSMGIHKEKINEVILNFEKKISEYLAGNGGEISELRCRVIDFSDFATEAEDAIRCSAFFNLPKEKASLESHLQNIDYYNRGVDYPENALEALWVAINSDWVTIRSGENGRHVIVMITDALPLHLQERKGAFGYYEDDYPASFEELTEEWNASAQDGVSLIHPVKRRLILYTPRGCDFQRHSWECFNSIESYWEKTATMDFEGFKECSADEILHELCNYILCDLLR